MRGYKEATVGQIADFLKNETELNTSVCILVGAGVSVSAGIPDAKGIMQDIQAKYPRTVGGAAFKSYSECMSLLTDGVRRQLIRNYMDRARLSKSVSAIARLVKGGYIDRILTTNFDPLLERALSLYGCEPKVHDFALSQIFVPGEAGGLRLFYLHGRADGFLLLNTEDEIKTLSDRLGGLFSDSSIRRAWIVVGYSGDDKPVFDALRKQASYDFGLYWVGYRRRDPSRHVREHLLQKKNAYFVRAEDADSFFMELLDTLELGLEGSFRPKTSVPPDKIDKELNRAGKNEAADILGVNPNQVVPLAFRIFHEKTGIAHLHRVFIRKSDFDLIAAELKDDPTLNVIRALIRKKGLSLHVRKSHRLICTTVGDDGSVLNERQDTPALIHAQISYAEVKNGSASSGESQTGLEPVELLLTKYVTPISICGYLVDRTPKKGFAHSKAAEDLFTNEAYRYEVTESVESFFYPFSHLGLCLANVGKGRADSLPSSGKPEKLLRISLVSDDFCDYDCTFCCQTREKARNVAAGGPTPEACELLAKAAVQSGCHRVMLTGGEPLLCPRERLVESVKKIASIDGLNDFWICSNGSQLDQGLCSGLRDSGLEKIVITIGAETAERYSHYTRQNYISLQHVLENIKAAVDAGLNVRIDVPLSRDGIKNYTELLTLVAKVAAVGVRQLSYFQLHKTPHNSKVFKDLFVPHEVVTWELAQDNDWQVIRLEREQKAFLNGEVEIIIPARILPETTNCTQLRCSRACQGVYAAYARMDDADLILQGCHRQLEKNTIRIPNASVSPPHVGKLSSLFTDRVWNWAYQRS